MCSEIGDMDDKTAQAAFVQGLTPYMKSEVMHGWDEQRGTLQEMIRKAWIVYGSVAPPWLQAMGGVVGRLQTPLGPTPMELDAFRVAPDQQRSSFAAAGVSIPTPPIFAGPTYAAHNPFPTTRELMTENAQGGGLTNDVREQGSYRLPRESRQPGYRRQSSQESRRFSGRSASPRGHNGVRCFTCGRIGHRQRECWRNREGQQERINFHPSKFTRQNGGSQFFERRCYKCQQPGHLANECPEQGDKVSSRGGSPRKFDKPGGQGKDGGK